METPMTIPSQAINLEIFSGVLAAYDFFDGAEGVDTLIIQSKDKDNTSLLKKNGNWVVTYTEFKWP